MPRRTALRSLVALLAAAFFVLALSGTAAGGGSPTACENRTNNTYDKLLGCVTVDGVREHQAALQAIADANGGTRAAGTSGYDASVAYVIETMEAAGWSVEIDLFDFTVAQPIQQHTPTPPSTTRWAV